MEQEPKNTKAQAIESNDFQIADMADIAGMPENTLAEIRSKERAYNDHILTLDRVIPTIKSDSGSNSEKTEEAIDESADMQIVDKLLEDMRRARKEMARLVDKVAESKGLQEAA